MEGTSKEEAKGGSVPSYLPAVVETADTPLAAMPVACTTAAKLRMASRLPILYT